MKVNIEIDFTEIEIRNLLGDYFIEPPCGDMNLIMVKALTNEKLGDYFKRIVLNVNRPDEKNDWKLNINND